MLANRFDAYRLLRSLAAPARLIRHVELVGEAGDALIGNLLARGIHFDAQLVECGIAIHDVGKILFPAELDGPGSSHESAGERLLLEKGVDPRIAHCCVSHAAWAGNDVTFEERLIALADKLWKGKREDALELLVIDSVAERAGCTRWDLFAEFDSLFEDIAAGAADRLERSKAV
ncbi:HD domain-containing protein [Paraburkholderia steynii]|uniref:HD domain-containing protein n=1 Tax=Paraburkholderia steynii TaxID=1245441 RepID=UPI000B88BE30|nr:HD domain-containing protein [Paraburkholderia steynii]